MDAGNREVKVGYEMGSFQHLLQQGKVRAIGASKLVGRRAPAVAGCGGANTEAFDSCHHQGTRPRDGEWNLQPSRASEAWRKTSLSFGRITTPTALTWKRWTLTRTFVTLPIKRWLESTACWTSV